MAHGPVTSRRPHLLAGILTAIASCEPPELEIRRAERSDLFVQSPAAAVDVVVVVDNSRSMTPFQSRVAPHLASLTSSLDAVGTDWRVGVITTTVTRPATSESSGCSPKEIAAIPDAGGLVGGTFIDRNTPDPTAAFAALVEVGVCGSGLEMGLEAAARALTATGLNAGFRRQDAELTFVFVSDGEDSSPQSVDAYLAAYQAAAGSRKGRLHLAALLALDPATCTPEEAALAAPGHRYIAAVERTGGVIADLCADDVAASLADVSESLAGLERVFLLSDLPLMSTLEVEVNGVLVDPCAGAWAPQTVQTPQGAALAIVFPEDQTPPPQATVLARYDKGDGIGAPSCTTPSEDTP